MLQLIESRRLLRAEIVAPVPHLALAEEARIACTGSVAFVRRLPGVHTVLRILQYIILYIM